MTLEWIPKRQIHENHPISIFILMFSFISVQAETFQPTDWYVFVYHEGCVPMSVMHKEFPYFTGARTPQEWLDKVRYAPPGMSTPFFGDGPQPDAELRPFTEVMQEVTLVQDRF